MSDLEKELAGSRAQVRHLLNSLMLSERKIRKLQRRNAAMLAALEAAKRTIMLFHDSSAEANDPIMRDVGHALDDVVAAIAREKSGGLLDPVRDAASDLLAALADILDHVEDPNVERVPPNQCTLCYTFRMKGHRAIAKALGSEERSALDDWRARHTPRTDSEGRNL